MADGTGYWTRIAKRRMTRRGVLRAGAAGGAGGLALSLIGCGGGGDDDKEASSLVFEPVDTSSKAVRGGILPIHNRSDIAAFDTTGSQETDQAGHAYSRVVKYEATKYPKRPTGTVVADAATSWEISPDGTTYTYKLRPNFKFDPRPPTNGRVMTSADVKYSWERFVSVSPYRANLAQAASPAAPVVSFTAPDAGTIVYKLAFPYAPFNPMLAFARHSQILPQEYETVDLRTQPRGTAAWRLKEYVASARFEWLKNPDWYENMNLDGVTYHIITENATGLSQLRAGAIATFPLPQEDILPTKQAVPELQMLADIEFPHGYTPIRFGYLPGSPFLDERVRRAFSMLIDRDLFIETFGNVTRFTDVGLDVPMRWHTAVPAGEELYWIDPSDPKKFGEHAQWFQHNPTEARKLLQAAGKTIPFETEYSYANDSSRAAQYIREQEVISGMLQDAGLVRLKINTLDYRTQFRDQYLFGLSKVNGLYPGAGMEYPEVDGWLGAHAKSDGVQGGHVGPDGKPDAYLDGLIDDQRKEVDQQKRTKIIQEIQQYMAGKMYRIPGPGDALGFSLHWPWLMNRGAYNTPGSGGVASNETFQYLWIDNSKKQA